MSWREFQTTLKSPPLDPRRKRRLRSAVLLGAGGFAGAVYLLFGVQWFSASEEAPSPVRVLSSGNPSEKLALNDLVDPRAVLDGPSELRVARGSDTWLIDLSLDGNLQRFIQKELKRNKVDWAGVAVLDPSTGEVLALGSHSEKEPGIDNLALRATFPAASVFKMVTASAALEEGGYRRDSTVSFSGNMYGIGPRQVLRDSGRNGMTLAKAFAKSANIVFGKIAARNVNGGVLEDYARRFGFDDSIPFELKLAPSVAQIPKDDVADEARTAAGFGHVTLSPLHGAMLAGSVLNEGLMMEPYVIRKVTDSEGEVKYEGRPRAWRQAISAVTARDMRRMMLTTVTEGTAQRSFRRFEKNPILGRLQLGGKTGSISGKNPPGKTEWYVGYARSQERQIAVGIVIVSDRFWRIKPSLLFRDIVEYEFSPRAILEAKAEKVEVTGP
ncbi:MAG: penicillin-binding transpeptidase domain-containing protein [Pseudomonadota bacterium]